MSLSMGCTMRAMKTILYFVALALLPLGLHAAPPKPPSKLCLDEVCVADPEPGTRATKWNPGHYMLLWMGDSRVPSRVAARCNEIANEPNVKGLKLRFYWRDIEPTKGNYNFVPIANALAACGAHGKRIVFDVQTRKFGGDGSVSTARELLPDYLIDESGYGWSAFGQGVTAKVWLSSVTERFILMHKALAARFDREPYLEAVNVFSESAPGWHSVTPPGDYSGTAWITQMKRRQVSIAPLWANTITVQGFNWLPGGTSNVPDMMAHLKNSRVAIGGPDIFAELSRLTDGQKGFTGNVGSVDYRPTVPGMWDVQSPELGGQCGSAGDYTAAQINQFAINTLAASHVFWIRNTCGDYEGNWATGILPVIRNSANALKNVSCPRLYGTCNTD
jgi:hypothetical protein